MKTTQELIDEISIHLTEEQKQQVLREVAHYLRLDCYDFGISVGDFNLVAGELANCCFDEDEEFLEEKSP